VSTTASKTQNCFRPSADFSGSLDIATGTAGITVTDQQMVDQPERWFHAVNIVMGHSANLKRAPAVDQSS